ncbi:hypothetical protein [Enterobacter sp. CPE_E1241]|uniref:hypothetical protein n=1 Tax=Enterobacter sp. CPE_E1241 TaxID=3376801 RepID=UPI00388FE2C2
MSASHSAGTTLLQMQIVINNIINKICSETKKTGKHEVIRVTALTTGSEAWWQSKKGPEWKPEKGIYGHSRFCNTDFDDKLACLNLSGV